MNITNNTPTDSHTNTLTMHYAIHESGVGYIAQFFNYVDAARSARDLQACYVEATFSVVALTDGIVGEIR